MKKAIALSIATLFCCVAFAQSGIVTGTVKLSDGQPAEYLNVAIKETGQATIVDNKGSYELKNISPGTYTLVISSIGVKSTEQRIEVRANETTVVPELVLAISTQQLSEVLVTSYTSNNERVVQIGKAGIKPMDLPQSVSSINKDVLEQQQSATLGDVVKNFNGVYVMGTTGGYQEELAGRGYLPPFAHSKNLRDTELGVKIEFLVVGAFPGDGKPKPVSFPDPDCVTMEHEGVRFVNLQTLIELKLASGMTAPDRQRDLVDVQELIKVRELSKEFAGQLNPYVQEKYAELWAATRATTARYITLWRNKFLTVNAKSLDEMIESLGRAAEQLKAMRDDGVVLDPSGGTAADYAYLVTTNPEVAKKYGMLDEHEFWGEDLDEEGNQPDMSDD